MKVKITDWTEDKYYWYKSRIGEVFEVKEDSNNSNYYCTSTGARIAKSDTIPVNEIKYELESNVRCDTCVTSCEYKKNTMVGSVGCSKCEYNCGDDKTSQTVQCSWQMDLKSIAVKFENVEQRKEIFEKFESKGFKLAPNKISTEGFIGYSEMAKYVCVLTDCGRSGKQIISYEEFIGGKEMKRLDIRKDHKSEKCIVVHCNSDIETVVKLLNDKADVITTILIGKRGVSLKMANDIIKLFNIPYELVEQTDWSKVEEGAEVTWIEELVYNSLAEVKIKANFHSYIPKMNKVVVIIGDEVKVVDEDKVELV